MGEVARVTEITARSETSFEDAVKTGIERASQTLRHVSGAWIKEQKVEIEDGHITQYHVDMLVTFVLDDAHSNGDMMSSAETSRPSSSGAQQPMPAMADAMAGERGRTAVAEPQVEGVPR